MARAIFLVLLAALAVGAVWYVTAYLSGRPFVSDTLGKVLVLLTLAGLAFWLFGFGGMIPL